MKMKLNKTAHLIKKYLFSKIFLILVSLFILSFIVVVILIYFDQTFFYSYTLLIGIFVVICLFLVIVMLSCFTVLSLREYKSLFTRKNLINIGRSYLTMEGIFENKNRSNILYQILHDPGIHHNELLRRCDLSKGQLQWHLDTLLRNNIILKRKSGQYSLYFPVTTSLETIEKLNSPVLKSSTAMKILQIVRNNPGVRTSDIARQLNLARNSIKYHVDRLVNSDLIYSEKRGRVIELYPK